MEWCCLRAMYLSVVCSGVTPNTPPGQIDPDDVRSGHGCRVLSESRKITTPWRIGCFRRRHRLNRHSTRFQGNTQEALAARAGITSKNVVTGLCNAQWRVNPRRRYTQPGMLKTGRMTGKDSLNVGIQSSANFRARCGGVAPKPRRGRMTLDAPPG